MQSNRTRQRPKQKAAVNNTGSSRTVSVREPREGSAMWAAIQVLRGRRKPMTAEEIYAEIDRERAIGIMNEFG